MSKIIQMENHFQIQAGASSIVRGRVLEVNDNGSIVIASLAGDEWLCDFLECGSGYGVPLAADDIVLVHPPQDGLPGIVLGRVGRYRPQTPEVNVVIEATDALTLKCGNSVVDLRADGKVLIKGDDVTVRAKGTKRIRAGSVSIN